MWALEAGYRPGRRSLIGDTPAGWLFGLALAFVALRTAVTAGWLPEAAVRIAGVAVAHGDFWRRRSRGHARIESASEACGRRLVPGRSLIAPAGVLALAGAAADLSPTGAIAYLAVPLLVWHLGRETLLTLVPSAPALEPRAILVGGLVGAVLGAHLVIAASGTFGHHPRLGEVTVLLGAIAYDAGANALSAESFFRGALWRRLYYHISFRAALGASTAACVGRYLVDPLLPKTLEMAVGAIFYVAVLGAANCWLLRWSGSIVPGYVASLVFFAAYRLLDVP